MAAPHHRLVGLDALRFIAAALVMIFHLGFWSWAPAPSESTPAAILRGATAFPELVPFAWWGWVGVEIFFIISGFVIAYSASGRGAWSFFTSRVLRLLPAAIVCATVTLAAALALALASPADLATRYLRSVLFWPFGPWIDGVYWTLGVELAFYSGVLLLLLLRRMRWLEAGMAAIGLLSAAFFALHYFTVSPVIAAPAPFGIGWRIHQLILSHHGMYFAAGVFLWLGTTKGWNARRIVVLALCLAGGCFPILAEANSKVAIFSLGHRVAWVPVVIWTAAVGLMWLSIVHDPRLARLPRPLLRGAQVAGLATYPLYLLHDVVGAATLRFLLSLGAERFAALALAGGAMIVAAVVVTLTAERWLRAFFARGLASAPTAGT